MRGGMRALDGAGVAAGVPLGAVVGLVEELALGTGPAVAGAGEGLGVVPQPATSTATRAAPMRDRWNWLVIRGC